MNSPASREEQILRIILTEGVANLLLLTAKTMVGLLMGPITILSDAVYSMTDTASNIVAYFVIRFSSRPTANILMGTVNSKHLQYSYWHPHWWYCHSSLPSSIH